MLASWADGRGAYRTALVHFVWTAGPGSNLLPLFVFNGTATTEIYTLSRHDALPVWDTEAASLAWATHGGGGGTEQDWGAGGDTEAESLPWAEQGGGGGREAASLAWAKKGGEIGRAHA